MTNKKRCTCILFITAVFIIMATSSYASDFDEDEISRIYQGIFENLGGEALYQSANDIGLPEEVFTDPVGLSNFLGLRNIVNFLTGNLPDIITDALSDFTHVFAIILVYALATALQNVAGAEYTKLPLHFTFVIALALSVYQLTGDAFRESQLALIKASDYFKISLPIIVGAQAASGKALSSLVTSSGLSVVISLFSSFNANYIIPFVNVFFSLALASAINTNASLKGICKSAKEVIFFILKISTTSLVALLTFQKVVARAGDTFAMEIAKLSIGSFVPIVGKIITDALGVVVSCANVIRATVGTVGAIVIIAIVLPTLIRVALYHILFKIGAGFSEMFEKGSISEFMRSISDMWSILLAVTFCQVVYFVASLAILASG